MAKKDPWAAVPQDIPPQRYGEMSYERRNGIWIDQDNTVLPAIQQQSLNDQYLLHLETRLSTGSAALGDYPDRQ